MPRSSNSIALAAGKKRPLRNQGRKPRLVVQDKAGPAIAGNPKAGIAKVGRPKAAIVKAGPAKTGNAKADSVKADSKEPLQGEWEEVSEELDEFPDIYSMLDKPAPERSCDTGVRRRIEMLREERQLQQALSEVFDF
jgi:hypothetical protein